MKTLCKKGILMQKGSIQHQGAMSDVIQQYMLGVRSNKTSENQLKDFRTISSNCVKFLSVKLINQQENTNLVFFKDKIKVELELEAFEKIGSVLLDCKIISIDGIEITHSMNQYQDQKHILEEGKYKLSLELNNDLQPGNYYLTFGIHRLDGYTLEYIENCLSIEVLSISKDDSSGHYYDFKLGYLRVNANWILNKL
jgi:hypothetical protein